jgi:hypothetical protein
LILQLELICVFSLNEVEIVGTVVSRLGSEQWHYVVLKTVLNTFSAQRLNFVIKKSFFTTYLSYLILILINFEN